MKESIFKSRILSNERKILIYLPSGYEKSDRRYPSIYIGDGAIYAERGFPELIDYAIAEGLCRPLIAVFVDPVVRREEYRMHEGYRRFMTEELVPFIDESYRTLTEPSERATLGAFARRTGGRGLGLFSSGDVRLCRGFELPRPGPRISTKSLLRIPPGRSGSS